MEPQVGEIDREGDGGHEKQAENKQHEYDRLATFAPIPSLTAARRS
jgi:hypothetical protein